MQQIDTPAFPYITYHTLVVGVVPTMGGKIECYGESLLSRCEVAAVEGIGLFGSGESCILSDGPRAEGVHHGVGAAQEGWKACRVVKMLHIFDVRRCVDLLYFYLFGCVECLALSVVAGCVACVGKYIYVLEILSHGNLPKVCCLYPSRSPVHSRVRG